MTTGLITVGPSEANWFFAKKAVDGAIVTCLFVYLGFYVAFNTVQVISRRVVGRAEETST